MADAWLLTLKAPGPQSGYELAVKLSRVVVKMTQPGASKCEELRKIYEMDAQALIEVSAMVATHFQTITQANNYWSDIK